MMKRNTHFFAIAIILFLSTTAFGQEAIVNLNQSEKGNMIREATQSLNLLPGFSYKATQGETFIGRINNGNEGNNNVPNYNDATGGSGTNPDPDFHNSIQGNLDINQLGGAQYSIPILIPPGTAGMQPQIAVVYNSQSGNGLLGVKWNLAGLSAISRVNKNLHDDGEIKKISLSDDDALALDGNRLIKVSNSPYYMTANETFAKITVEGTAPNTWFRVEQKNGQIFEYGNSEDSKIYALGDYNIKVPLAWRISKIIDPNGNYMQFFYENLNDESVIRKIVYTGNSNTSLLPYNSIIFDYKKRNDVNSQYIKKDYIYQSNILVSIKVLCEEVQVKEYAFEYHEGRTSRLTTIKEIITEDITSSLTISWGNSPKADVWDIHSSLRRPSATNTYRTVIGDFNGDGFSDILVFRSSGFGEWELISGKDNQKIDITSLPTNFILGPNTSSSFGSRATIGDFNGDGKDDILLLTESSKGTYGMKQYDKYTYTMYLSKGNSFEAYKTFNFPESHGDYNENVVMPLMADFTGDGRTDILFVSKIHKGSQKYNIFDLFEYGVSEGKSIELKDDHFVAQSVKPFDFEGDGIMEVMALGSIGSLTDYVFSFKGGDLNYKKSVSGSSEYLADVDGDGRDDMVRIAPDKLSYSIGKYDGYQYVFGASIPLTPYYSKNDENLFISFYPWSTHKDGWTNSPPWAPLPAVQALYQDKSFLVKDFNGDGKADLLEFFLLAYPEYDDPVYGYHYPEKKRIILNLRLSGGGMSTMSFDDIEMPEMLGDFNGDGNPDLIIMERRGAYTFFNERYSSENLVSSITDNNINESVNIVYRKASDPVHTKGTGSQFPYNDYAGPLPIVFSKEIPNAVGGKNKTEYLYSGLTIHRQGRGLLGFKEIVSTDYANNTRTKVVFGETDSPVKAWYPKETTVSTINGNLIQKTTSTMAYKSPIPGRKFGYNYPVKEEVTDYLYGSNYYTDYVYDNYGNMTQTKTVYPNQTIENVYEYINAAGWIPSLPSSHIETSVRDGITYSRKKNYYYDSKGNQNTTVSDPNTSMPVTTVYAYNNCGLPVSVSVSAPNAETRIQTFGYDSKYRFVTNTQNDQGQPIVSIFEPFYGKILSERNETTGLIQTWRYQPTGQLKETTTPDGNITKTTIKKASGVPQAKYYILMDTPGKPYQKIYYDAAGREVRGEIQGFDAKIIKEKIYNARGLLVSESDPYKENKAKVFKTFEYDDLGRIKNLRYKELTSSYIYDGNAVKITNSAGQTTVKSMDPQGNIILAIDPEGNEVNYTYHPSGQMKTVVSEGRTLVQMEYDAYGRQTALKDIDAGTMRYQYDVFGQLTRQEDPLGNVFSLHYDKFGKIVRKEAPNGTYFYSYYEDNNASNGMLRSVTGPDGMSQQYEYNQWGGVSTFTDVVQNEPFQTKYGYDQYRNVNLMSYPSGFTIENKYNKAGFLYEVKNVGSSQSIWKLEEADAWGIALKIMNGNGLRTEYTYNDYKTLVGIKTGNIQDLEYTVFAPNLQLISSRTDKIMNISETFQYDNLNQLTHSQVEGTLSPIQTVYESNGNIVYRTGTGNYFYRDDKIHAVERVTTSAKMTPSQQTISYNAMNKVSSITEGIYKYQIEYGVDAERSKMYEYINDNLSLEKIYTLNYEREIRGNSIREIHYIPTPTGSTAIFLKENNNSGSIYYLCKDHLGSITALVDGSGNVSERYAYDPWGRRVSPDNWTDFDVSPNLLLSRGYTGHEHLDYIGLINMNGRMYDPLLGRMLSPDNLVPDPSLPLGYNRYAYCYNNPMSFTDPDGENPFAWGMAIGIYLFKFYNDGRNANNGTYNPFKWDNWSSVNWVVGYSSVGNNAYFGADWTGGFGLVASFNGGSWGWGTLRNGIGFNKGRFSTIKLKELLPFYNNNYVRNFAERYIGKKLMEGITIYADESFPKETFGEYVRNPNGTYYSEYQHGMLCGLWEEGAVYLYKSAFESKEELYFTIMHEIMHEFIDRKYPGENADLTTVHSTIMLWEYEQSKLWNYKFYDVGDYYGNDYQRGFEKKFENRKSGYRERYDYRQFGIPVKKKRPWEK